MNAPRDRIKRFAPPLAVSAFLAATAAPAQAQFKPCKGGGGDIPCLKIDIPSVHLTGVTTTKGDAVDTINVPFLAEYISGVYQFGLYAAVIVAGVMMIIGGFEWLTSGDSGRMSKAKDRITNAVIGVVLALVAYTLLHTIDPRLVKLSGLSIDIVKQIPLDENLLTTTADTVVRTGPPVVGEHVKKYQSCPIQLTNPGFPGKPNPARSDEFEEKMKPLIIGGTAAEKILQVADAATVCQVNMGSCGQSAGRVKEIAGVASGSCKKNISDVCWGNKTTAISPELHRRIRDLLCTSDTPQPNCLTDGGQAFGEVLKILKESPPSGWPDQWANALKPGDTIVVYNGNSTGTHSLIFTGWSSDKKKIQVMSGSVQRNFNEGSLCITSNCGEDQTPLLKVFHTD